jgi:hypothetical protein
MARISFRHFSVDVPPEWGEVKAEETYDGPVLSGPSRSGRLLFQVTPHEPGSPSLGLLTPDQLLGLVRTFGETRLWEAPTAEAAEGGTLRLASASFVTDDGDCVRVWNVMSGLNYAVAFYRSGAGGPGNDLPLCERAVRSIEFDEPR